MVVASFGEDLELFGNSLEEVIENTILKIRSFIIPT
ncbi:hypothetical protein APA386B_431 [Acetobacter pasteurianus 386B]|nr:hypothetical protein APA386B_431 [Acetobacter pasteurianus 386B]